VNLIGTNAAEKDFEELLSAAWAAQLAQLRARTGSGEWQADPDSQKTTGKEGDDKTFKHKKAFAARTLEASGQAYAMRNERQIPMSPLAHKGSSQKTGLKKESP
jgi:type II secretory pathway pseudopilin PulG